MVWMEEKNGINSFNLYMISMRQKLINLFSIKMQVGPKSKLVDQEILNLSHCSPWDQPSSCSYCNHGQSFSWGFNKEKMHPYTYQMLMDRGWRRCGTYYYKMDLARTCCKQWTVRHDVTKFHLKKDQKKTVRRMLELAYDSIHIPVKEEKKKGEKKEVRAKITMDVGEQQKNMMKELALRLNSCIKNSMEEFMSLIGKENIVVQDFKQRIELQGIISKLRYFTSKRNEKSDYYCNYGMLLFGLNKKMFKKGYNVFDMMKSLKGWIQQNGKLADNYFVEVERSGYLLISLHDCLKANKSDEFQIIQIVDEKIQKNETSNQQIQIADQYQELIPIKKESLKTNLTITSDQITFGKISIKIVPAEESQESWNLYRLYCQDIHKTQQNSMSEYVGFLCEKGFTYMEDVSTSQTNKQFVPSWDPDSKYQDPLTIQGRRIKKMGCYHMKYYYEDRLIGVGVVDLLPHGLSSVYYFYDPSFKKYRLGVFSSLIEIEYARWLQLSFPEFKYYYMGFYIQNNKKMSYKVDYEPVQILCPVTYNFVPFTPSLKQHIEKIIKKQINSIRIAPEKTAKIRDMKFTTDLGVFINQNIKLRFKNQEIKLSQVTPQLFVPVLNILRSYCEVWGQQLFKNFIFTL